MRIVTVLDGDCADSLDLGCVTCQDGDVSSFVFVSGRPCLDFAGTLLWRRTLRIELLETPGDLRSWAAQARVVDDLTSPAAGDLEQALVLREAIYGVVRGARAHADSGGADAAALNLLNSLACGPLPTLTLTPSGAARREGAFGNVASLLARDTIDLVGSDDLPKVKECTNPDCTRLFVDQSRGASRRWCGMAECGNRAKAADYRRRKKARVAEGAGR